MKKGTPREILEPQESNLEIVWYTENKRRYYTVICRFCECRKLYIWPNGVRCEQCGSFHSHDRFNKLRLKCQELAKFNDGRVKAIRHIGANSKRRFGFNAKTKKLFSAQDAIDAEVITLVEPNGRSRTVRVTNRKKNISIPILNFK